MSELGEIPAPDRLNTYLRSFPSQAQEKGNALFNQSLVQTWSFPTKGQYQVTVLDGAEEHIDLSYHPVQCRWQGLCSCPLRRDCHHLYAAGKSLLAEHSLALVNDLAAGLKTSAPSPPAASDLARKLTARLARPLTAEEASYLRKVHQAYLRSCESAALSTRDLLELGINLGRPGWSAVLLWEEFPQTESLFWLHVARAAQNVGQPIPSFMQAVTDLAELDRAIAQAQQRQFIELWRQKLATSRFAPRPGQTARVGEYDFRVVLGTHSAFLEWKPPGEPAFAKVKLAEVQQLLASDPTALAQLPTEAEIILQTFLSYNATYTRAELVYIDPTARILLGRLLTRPTLSSRTVSTDGQPLRRGVEPLRWELIEPAPGESDYTLRLVQPDGEGVPKFLFSVGRYPVLYVSHQAVFRGPPTPDTLGDQTEVRIPAAALESDAGVGFARRLGLTLPARVQGRIQMVPVSVTIRCHLQRLYATGGPEVCVIRADARSRNEQRTWTWRSSHWRKEAAPPDSANSETIRVYDESLLDQVAEAINALGAHEDINVGALCLRVTKRFPELFSDWLRTIPPAAHVQLEGELASLLEGAVAGRVHLDLTATEEIDWFDLRVVLNVSDTTLTQEELKLLLNARGGFVRLKGRGWRRLEFNLSPEEDEQLARLGLTPRALSAEPQRMHALQLADPAAQRFLPEEQVQLIQRRVAEIKVRVTPDIPGEIKAELRPYQREGFHFLAYLSENRFGGILADDMGLGKTLQTLTWLAWVRERWSQTETSPPPASLVVCPKSVMDNWRAEAARFASQIRVKLWEASELASLGDRLTEADLHVLNYSQLRMAGEGIGAVHWLAAILDEGQYIKNPNSQTAQIARVLHARYRLVLSGTPIENCLLDLWSLMSFAMPGTLGSRPHFSRLYDAKDDPFARKRLAVRVRPFLLRRTKDQVARDLPDRVEEDLYCEIEGEQRSLYRAELKRAQQLLLAIQTQKELAQQQFHFLTALLRLRQICCHPKIYKPDSQSRGAKLEALLEQLEPLMAEGHKVLVFSQFVEVLQLLQPALAQRGWPVFYLAGDTENRGELVSRFQQSSGAAVFLISLKAGGFGLNLTAASYVVLFDPWWNPAVENQAIDRTHRIGQVNKVMAYRLLIKNSIEEKIRQLQKTKSALAEDVLGEEKFAQSLTLEDLRYLLADT